MIKEAYCSFEVAKLLKEKGFNEPCRAIYEEEKVLLTNLWNYYNSELSSDICSPTHQMAMSWLREKEIFIVINYNRFYKTYRYNIYSMDIDIELDCADYNFKSYEDACDAALLYSLENLI